MSIPGRDDWAKMIARRCGVSRVHMARWLVVVVVVACSTGHKLGMLQGACAFQRPTFVSNRRTRGLRESSAPRRIRVGPLPSNRLDDEVGGYTTRQRLREEIESPFRKVRLLFFGSTTGSALTALYFSAINAVKAMSMAPGSLEATTGMTSYGSPVVSLDEALSACAINLTGAVVCAFLTVREYRVGQANLERIKRGGQLARLAVLPAVEPASASAPRRSKLRTLTDYRRSSRVVIAAGGPAYVSELRRQLASDPSQQLVEAVEGADLVVVPVLLQQRNDDSVFVSADTQETWYGAPPRDGSGDPRPADVSAADPVVAFPMDAATWSSFLEAEIATARSQGYDVLDKGITIVVKKNGRILRRSTGLPNWADLVSRIEVMDGSKFGMPGDDEKYGKR